MPFAPRKFAFLVLAGLALAAAGCGGSNNKGKIVGKWKFVGLGDEKDAKLADEDKLVLFMEFKDDGTGGFGLEVVDPNLKKMFKANEDGNSAAFKYKLLKGDEVEFYDLPKQMQGEKSGFKKDRGKAVIKITGDDMTMTVYDDDNKEKSARLSRLK